jgi:protein involved in polysaccharide export with SLBB domain
MFKYFITISVSFLFSQPIMDNQNLLKSLLESGLSVDEAMKLYKGRNIGNDDLFNLEKDFESQDDFDKISNQNKKILQDEKIKKQVRNEILFNETVNALDDSTLFLDDSMSVEASFSIDSIRNNNFLPDERILKKIQKRRSDKIDDLFSSADKKKEYFGYDIFNGDPDVFQRSTSQSIDQGYIIGPGDEILIMLWGETELNEKYIVSRDGYIFISNVGQVFVNGHTLEKLEEKLSQLLKKVYSSLGSGTKTNNTYLDVSLGSMVLRPIRVFALGDVEKPGSYSVKPSSTLFTSMFYFNGPSLTGSLRNIDLIRNSKKVGSIDFYDYLLTGTKSEDFRLQRDDVVFINPRGKTVKIVGMVNREKFFELKNDEGLKYLIDIAGGLKAQAYSSRVQIERITPFTKRIDKSVARTKIDVSLENILFGNDDFLLEDADIVTVFSIDDKVKNVVNINGAIKRPGDYDLSTGLKLSDLIYKADSLLGDAYMDRADVFRLNKDLSESHIKVDLNKVMEKDPQHDIYLKSNDEIVVYSLSSLEYYDAVSISGHVLNPGEFPFRKNMDVSDLIFFGGGFKNKDHLSNTYFKRADLTRLDSNQIDKKIITFPLDSVLVGKSIANMKLSRGDAIRIYSIDEIEGLSSKTVSIEGYVKRPGEYSLFEQFKLSNLLFMAGGMNDLKFFSKTYLQRGDLVRLDENLKTKSIIKFNLNDVLNDESDNDILLMEGDLVRIYSKDIFETSRAVKINGIVKNPGSYELKSNMTLEDLLFESGGVEQDNPSFRCEISRLNPSGTYEENISLIKTFDINNTKSDFKFSKGSKGFILKPFDIVYVRPNPYFSLQESVVVEGSVYYPGEYAMISKNEKVSDLINRAGGLLPHAFLGSSKLVRDSIEVGLAFEKIINNPKSKFNFVLNAGDKITIGKKPNLIIVEGEVNNPGYFQYIRGYNLKDYIRNAGGLKRNASQYGHYVIYPDGLSKSSNFLNRSIKVVDGSKIVILADDVAEKLNITEYLSNLTKIYSDLTQLYLLVVLAQR